MFSFVVSKPDKQFLHGAALIFLYDFKYDFKYDLLKYDLKYDLKIRKLWASFQRGPIKNWNCILAPNLLFSQLAKKY